VEALISALDPFAGTLIFISHDVFFIRALANKVVRICSGQLVHYAGGYQYYLDKTAADTARAALTAPVPALGPKLPADDRPSVRLREQKRLDAERRQTRSRARQVQQQIVRRLEEEIGALERQQAALTVELSDPATYQSSGRVVTINLELAAIRERLPPLTAEWEAAATKLMEIDAAAR